MDLITPSSGLLFWMVLIFAIVFFILAKFGFPIITGMVGKRKAFIDQSLSDAVKAREQLDGMQKTCDEMIARTRAEQEVLLGQAREAAARIVEDAKVKAGKEAEEILRKAKEEIEVQKREAVDDVRGVVGTLAVAISEKILRENLASDEAQTALVDKMLEELNERRNPS